MMRRIASAAAVMGFPRASISATTGYSSALQFFSSNYNDIDNYKPPLRYSSRSGAHRQLTKKNSYMGTKKLDDDTDELPESTDAADVIAEGGDDPPAPIAPQRNIKNHYMDLYKPKPQRMSFRSTFTQSTMGTSPPAESPRPSRLAESHQTSLNRGGFDNTEEEADVTKIYSTEEVRHLVRDADTEHEAATNEDDVDVLKALQDTGGEDSMAPTRTYKDPDDNDGNGDELGTMEEAGCKSDKVFAIVRQHPFFEDLLHRVEKNMMRYRKEIRYTNRYNRDLINDCVRPLLQLTDYPFTTRTLCELANFINPIVLKNSLSNQQACKQLHLYHSPDTDLLLDWSVEDFLRRRYESIHLSWECMDVVYRRFGWNPEVISDRDCLLYFAEFSEFVELAKLERARDGKPRALLIEDAAAQETIPVSRLLIRRRTNAEVEPSVTESLRLLGTPAVVAKAAQGPKGRRARIPQSSESVSGMFSALEKAADEVKGDETMKLVHAMDSIRSLRQTVAPGHTVREFAIGKTGATEQRPDSAPSRQQRQGKREVSDCDAVNNGRHEVLDSSSTAYSPELYESLSNAYHKAKVEVSMLRRRLLGTDSVDEVAKIQVKLAESRKELNCLMDRLRQLRQMKQAVEAERGGGPKSAEGASDDGDDDVGFAIPRSHPKYPMAPEFSSTKNGLAAEDMEDDDDIDISKELDEVEAEMAQPTMPVAAGYAKYSESARPRPSNSQARGRAADEDGEAPAEAEAKACRVALPPTPAAPEEAAGEEEAEAPHAAMSLARPRTGKVRPAVALSRSEELAQISERVSSAAQQARNELMGVLEKKRMQEAAMAERVEAATEKVRALEARLEDLQRERREAEAEESRQAAEAKAKEVEEELRCQREKRQAELERQRKQAHLAQLEAQRALERQRKAEEDALAVERELMQKLEQARAQVSLAKGGAEDKRATAAAAPHRDMETGRPTGTEGDAQNAPPPPPSSTTAPFFMCTPEQYDGLHLAGDRLQSEIAALEKQMEQEDDEDDETLMAVLAASRADLEELNDCIASVRQHADWAAARDAAREREKHAMAALEDTEAHRLQRQVEHQRFQITLLEKRLQHATQRSVITKLEQALIHARRQISRLRLAQDRLRRSGQDTFGLPPALSLAETLTSEATDDTAEVGRDSASRDTAADRANGSAPEESEDTAHGARDDTAEMNSEESDDTDPAAELVAKAPQSDGERQRRVTPAASPGVTPASTLKPPSANMDPEAHHLHLRLESLLRGIQHLQDNISYQERSNSYDDDETEAVLLEMRKKLEQLLSLRDDVQQRLTKTAAKSDDSGEPTITAGMDGSRAPPAPPVVSSRAAATASLTATKPPSVPSTNLRRESAWTNSLVKRTHHIEFKRGGKRK